MTNNQSPSSIQTSKTSLISLSTQADQINQFHAQAYARAEEAIGFAKKAGELLLEVKNSLKHGQFQQWIEENCSCGVRQAQRYMNVALDKAVPIHELTLKSDTMSHLKPARVKSLNVTDDEKWIPERGYVYLFKDEEGSTYWVTPSTHETPHFHICKLYSGTPMSTEGFYWRYTVFGNNDYPELTHDHYIGTRFPLFSAKGVEGVLKSYGLKDIKKSLLSAKATENRYERPFGEPDTEIQYWPEDTFTVSDLRGTPSTNLESTTHPTWGKQS